ncbi:hypothetical protein [Flavobacterium sp. C4GT6]|uniref:hypothetical protein n=1 Tax=Flavobacterium sp. C4GT6 TaxID=3103818 RepID=UPI002ED39557
MEALVTRINNMINFCWESFSAKVGCGLIEVNKEASMQLHFAYILKNAADLVLYNKDEQVTIELETSIPVNGRFRECDIVIRIEKADKLYFLPIEMKCYKTKSSSGGLRGAQDLFRYGIYEDLQLLENYCSESILQGIQLTMTDSKNFVYPKSKTGKSWVYDISHGSTISEILCLDTPIGGKPVSVSLNKNYIFDWKQVGNYYFLQLKGI